MARPDRLQLAATAVLAVVLLTPRTQARTAPDLVQTWTAAVMQHVPGRVDDALKTIWRLSLPERTRLFDDVIFALQPQGTDPGRSLTGDAEIAALVGQIVAFHQTPDWFRARAVVLHTDAALFDDRPPEAARGWPHLIGPPARNFAVVRDGEFVGSQPENWNWPTARYLIAAAAHAKQPALLVFAARWYHATVAYMFRVRAFGALAPHLEAAASAVPGDAFILYDLGCLAETLTILAARLPEFTDPKVPVRLPSSDSGRATAAALFTRALAADGSLTEARVRLARLSEESGRFAEADADLAAALAAGPDSDVAYYAHLFAARSEMALGRPAGAQAHAAAALALFPEAESALIAASQIALLRGDVGAALRHLDGLADTPAGPPTGTDPWSVYVIGPGRIADDLLAKMWSTVPSRPQGAKH